MRILLATPIYPPEIGGPATYTHELAERLSGEHDITIVAYADEPEHIKETRLIVVSKKIFLPLRLWMYFYILLREAKNADVIYVQNAVAAGLPAALAGKLRHKPTVVKFVGDEAWERATQAGKTKNNLADFLTNPPGDFKTSIFISIQRFVLNRASAIVPPSQFLADTIETYYGVPHERVSVNYNAFEGIPETKITSRKPHQILSVARLVTWKHVDGILRALKIIKNSYQDITLVVAGEGPEEVTLKKLATDLGLAGSVIFRGRVSREDVAQLEGESGVMVLNSTYEGLPHIALEAFAAETPMVATDIPGTREAVVHEKTGLLVPPGDDATLAVALERIFDEENLRERLLAGGREALKEKFSWGAHIDKLLAVFAKVQQN